MIDGIFSIRGHEFYGDDGDDESHSMLVVQCGGKESKVGLVEREEREGEKRKREHSGKLKDQIPERQFSQCFRKRC